MTSPISRSVARILQNPHFLESAVLVSNSTGSRNTYGEFVAGSETRTAVQLATAPTSASERETLPAGLRESELRTFWMRESVKAIDELGSQGDTIEHDGLRYQVVAVKNWGGFYQAVGQLLGAAGDDPVLTGGDFNNDFNSDFDIGTAA